MMGSCRSLNVGAVQERCTTRRSSLQRRNMENLSQEHFVYAYQTYPLDKSLHLILGRVIKGVEKGQTHIPIWAPPIRKETSRVGKCFPNIAQFYRWRKWGSEMLSNLASIMHLILSGRTRNQGSVDHQLFTCYTLPLVTF